ncbi:MAG TPA: tetratricopeptide repeat protein [Phycisphaerales bacterium]|nr:tetratricopeptide repeat protein [Phycisphaerales bacterium]
MPKPGEENIRALREALSFSPDNVALRKHLAEVLIGYGRADEAERELREAVNLAPADHDIKTSLARVYLQLGRSSHALVILEDLAKNNAAAMTPAARVMFAQALHRTGDADRAAAQYRQAVAADPAVADAALAEQLGANARPPVPDEDDEDAHRIPAQDLPPASRITEVERPKVNFADIGGMEKVKEEIRLKIIHPLTHADLYKAYGKAIGGGILMYGPPGCGKTHLARATAGEVKARFIAVGINDILNMWMGESEKNLHEIFQQARADTPCVLFFDEVDALGASRTDLKQSAGRQLVNQFLAELDGLAAKNDGLLILAATNAPWHIDSAFRRPGRFDRIVFVPPPDAPARAAILRIMLAGKPVESIDHDQVAKKTEGFSGADLKNLIDVTVEAKLRAAMARGIPEPIRTADLLAAAKGLKPTTHEWFSTARNYALFSNQGGLYDDVLDHLKLR